jgi:deazaflavin-dependent oxidoreductase (nitroreductase family)
MKAPLICWRLGLEPLLRAMRLIVITTRGRKSHRPRHAMLEHSVFDGRVYIAPGWGTRTQWYQNVCADPRVTVQRNGRTYGAIARIITENSELAAVYHHAWGNSPVWTQFLDSWGVEDTLEDFLDKKARIPFLRLDPVEGPPPLPPLKVDLWWIWPMLGFAAYAVWHLTRLGLA